jgi:hypothetical protein
MTNPFTTDEIALLANPSFFELKSRATEKLYQQMEAIRLAFLDGLKPDTLLAPSATDFTRGQIAKGENYEGYPYIVLDFPKQFSQRSIFAVRTMFWYGHDLMFSVILAGENMDIFRARVIDYYEKLTAENFFFGIDDVWDWRDAAMRQFTTPHESEILKQMNAQPFLKLLKRFPPSLLSNEADVLREARTFFETVKVLVRK